MKISKRGDQFWCKLNNVKNADPHFSSFLLFGQKREVQIFWKKLKFFIFAKLFPLFVSLLKNGMLVCLVELINRIDRLSIDASSL